MQKINENFGDTEKIKRYTLIADEWSTANRILTPTLKVRRQMVRTRYQNVIESMFA